ncbi:Uncharacterized protein TCM_016320 [Theobroma cacao]|uniref:Uncharacterized protein n=1 Tax=Theobroma cacao TaxID=3641 RepID=A0A061G5I2_THECC|nr:Uncharacterized protein TCM_016320 [Theobroma cacao]
MQKIQGKERKEKELPKLGSDLFLLSLFGISIIFFPSYQQAGGIPITQKHKTKQRKFQKTKPLNAYCWLPLQINPIFVFVLHLALRFLWLEIAAKSLFWNSSSPFLSDQQFSITKNIGQER